eukprot:TRINITY_DN78817_c0_g1_i1.p2 TRINITY_DN78817_c0_g1~~TRINITY_DN78817_c0_g1_i1.p2  ORF type:complete len:105 (-),score=7.44 TRINITY_DN78817_c0_g1_i1:399-713(-)
MHRCVCTATEMLDVVRDVRFKHAASKLRDGCLPQSPSENLYFSTCASVDVSLAITLLQWPSISTIIPVAPRQIGRSLTQPHVLLHEAGEHQAALMKELLEVKAT